MSDINSTSDVDSTPDVNSAQDIEYIDKEEQPLFSAFTYITLGVIFFWLILIVDPFNALNYISFYLFYFTFAISSIITIFSIALYSNYKYSLTLSYKSIVYLIIILGILLRLFYTYYTPYYIRQHDLGTIGTFQHLDYMHYFSSNLTLPEDNYGQYYHPPLHHFILGIFIRLFEQLGYSFDRVNESLQYITCFYSSIIIFISYNIFEDICKNKALRLIALALVAVNPTFIILAGSLNNDVLSILFFLACLQYLIRWYKYPTVKNIFFMALAIGLGMMAKISVVMIAPVIAGVFLHKLISKKSIKIFAQCILFGILSIPLGMWSPILSLIRFNQPLGYVWELGPDSDIYTGQYSIFERFIFYPISEFINTPYALPYEDYNLWGYVLKCFTFGEYSFSDNVLIQAWVLLIFSCLVMIISLAIVFYLIYFYNYIESKGFFNIMLGIWVTQILSFVYFNIRYPFGCTMDTRYIVPMIISGCYFYYLYFETSVKIKQNPLINKIIYLIILGFILSSIWFYLIVF